MTKRTIATSIINELGQPFNHELYERIKDRIIALRAQFLRQSISKYGIDELLQQKYEVNLIIKTDEFGCRYYESECKIPVPIRAIGSASPYKFVGNIKGVPFTFLREYETFTIPNIPVNQLHKYYSISNRYIRTYNTTPAKLYIIDIFEDLDELIASCSKTECVDDDTLLPMPADFIDTIIRKLVEEFRAIPQTDSIKVEE